MKNTLITGGLLLDKAAGLEGAKKDILVSDGRIAEIADSIAPREDWERIELSGEYLSPGFIDTHAHVYTATGLGVNADDIGLRTGITTIFDAGSAGPENLDDFIARDIKTSETRILSVMHFVKTGLLHTPEADSPEKYDIEAAAAAVEAHRDTVVAIKARASNSTVGKMGIVPIRAAKALAKQVGLPLVVHIGNPPPAIQEVLDLMEAGDVITHAYHGKINGLLENGVIKEATQRARDRGVLFDVGHGVASFSFNTARTAFALGFTPDSISTDLHIQNINGPVYTLAHTMNKMLAMGIPLADCVDLVTGAPARIYSLDKMGLGSLRVGAMAEFTVFRQLAGERHYTDSDGNALVGDKYIDVSGVFAGGKLTRCVGKED